MELEKQIKSVLAAGQIPFDTVEVTDETIIIRQIGNREDAAAIVNILHVAGIRRLNKLKSYDPVKTVIDDKITDIDYSVVTLPR